MSDTEKKQWFFMQGFNKVSTLMGDWFSSEPEINPDSEVGELQYRISLNKSVIDDLSAYWYSLSVFGKFTRAGIVGVGVLAIGVVAQAPILVFSLYVFAALFINSVLSSHEEHRRLTSQMLVNESVTLTRDLNQLRGDHTALNEHTSLLVEGYGHKVEVSSQKIDTLNDTIQGIELEGKAIPEVLANIHGAVQERVNLEKQIIASHQSRMDALSQLDVDLESVLSAVKDVNKNLDIVVRARTVLNKDEEQIKDVSRINEHALFKPVAKPLTSRALEYLKNKGNSRKEYSELSDSIKKHDEIICRITQSVC